MGLVFVMSENVILDTKNSKGLTVSEFSIQMPNPDLYYDSVTCPCLMVMDFVAVNKQIKLKNVYKLANVKLKLTEEGGN